MAESSEPAADGAPEQDPAPVAESPADVIEPGRPVARDAIDPELLTLRKPRPRVGPLLALSVVALTTYLMITLRADLRFARQPDEPRYVADFHTLLPGGDHRDEFVRMDATPDRALAARVTSSSVADGGHRAAPVLGSGDALWLFVEGLPWAAPRAYDDVYQGRLRRIDDLPFADDLRAFVAAQPPAERFLSPATLRDALAGGHTSIRTTTGDTIGVAAATPVAITEIVAGRARIIAYSTELHADEAAWRAALEAAGLLAPRQPLAESTETSWTFEIDAPDGLDALASKLSEAGLPVRVAQVERRRSTTWGALAADDGGLRLGDTDVPWSSLSSVAVLVPRTLPDDALILLTDEVPSRYWYVLPLYGVLALFTALFLWALARSLRPDRPTAAQTAGGAA